MFFILLLHFHHITGYDIHGSQLASIKRYGISVIRLVLSLNYIRSKPKAIDHILSER